MNIDYRNFYVCIALGSGRDTNGGLLADAYFRQVNILPLNGFCFAVALYVIYDICHSADLQVHLGDQMQPSVQCGRKKIVVPMVPAGDYVWE